MAYKVLSTGINVPLFRKVTSASTTDLPFSRRTLDFEVTPLGRPGSTSVSGPELQSLGPSPEARSLLTGPTKSQRKWNGKVRWRTIWSGVALKDADTNIGMKHGQKPVFIPIRPYFGAEKHFRDSNY